MAFCMKKDEDHLPGRISISIAWLMAGGPPGVWGPHKTRYRKVGPASLNNRYGARLIKAAFWASGLEVGAQPAKNTDKTNERSNLDTIVLITISFRCMKICNFLEIPSRSRITSEGEELTYNRGARHYHIALAPLFSQVQSEWSALVHMA